MHYKDIHQYNENFTSVLSFSYQTALRFVTVLPLILLKAIDRFQRLCNMEWKALTFGGLAVSQKYEFYQVQFISVLTPENKNGCVFINTERGYFHYRESGSFSTECTMLCHHGSTVA